MFWEAVKETDRTGASSNDKGAVCRAFGPFGRPRQCRRLPRQPCI